MANGSSKSSWRFLGCSGDGISAKNGFSAKREKFATPQVHTHIHTLTSTHTHTHTHALANVRGAKQMLVNISAAVIPFR